MIVPIDLPSPITDRLVRIAGSAVIWMATPSITDWLNVLVVFALLLVTWRYAKSTDHIVRANQQLLEATRGILTETARQAEAASQAAQIAFEQWRQVRRDVLISIQTAIRDCQKHIDKATVQLERVMETGANDSEICGNFVLPSSFSYAVERARYVSSDVYEQLRSAESALRAACDGIEQATNAGTFADLTPAKGLAQKARELFGLAAELLDSLLRDNQ